MFDGSINKIKIFQKHDKKLSEEINIALVCFMLAVKY